MSNLAFYTKDGTPIYYTDSAMQQLEEGKQGVAMESAGQLTRPGDTGTMADHNPIIKNIRAAAGAQKTSALAAMNYSTQPVQPISVASNSGLGAMDPAQHANQVSANSAAQAMNFSAQQAQQMMDYQTAMWNAAAQYNSAEAAANRDWQKMMSDTAYQRVVKDLKAAGLNPILAYQQGGAQAMSGSAASMGMQSGAMGNSSSFSGDSSIMSGIVGAIEWLMSFFDDGAGKTSAKAVEAKTNKAVQATVEFIKDMKKGVDNELKVHYNDLPTRVQ